MTWTFKKPGRAKLTKAGHKSRLEDKLADQLYEAGIKSDYESETLHYVVPERKARYIPDFPIPGKKKIYIEGKGWFQAADRQKMILVKEQNPGLDIRIVFSKAQNKISKTSKTTYAAWAESHGFKWADGGVIPPEWIKEMKS